MARGLEAPAIPDDCEVLVVANQEWLSDAQIAGVAGFAKRGGHVVVTGESGLWDEHGAQRFENPLRSALADVSTAVWRDVPDVVGGSLGWAYRVEPPKDGGKALMDDIAKTGWRPKVRVEGLPPHVFVEIKKMPKGYAVFFLNYNAGVEVCGASLRIGNAGAASFEFLPFDERVPEDGGVAAGEMFNVPAFRQAALVGIGHFTGL